MKAEIKADHESSGFTPEIERWVIEGALLVPVLRIAKKSIEAGRCPFYKSVERDTIALDVTTRFV